MFVAQQLGQSANELVAKWGKGPYRYGFPDYIAVEFPVRPMNYDRSRFYSGVVGRHYPEALTERYYYLYDPNLYLQPGISGAADSGQSKAVVVGAAALVGVAGVVGALVLGLRSRSVRRRGKRH
jgi:hypothetical protein